MIKIPGCNNLQRLNFFERLKKIMISIPLFILLCCYENNNKKLINIDTTVMPKSIERQTFQEIGFFGNIKKDRWNDFLQAVRNNIANSRKEEGNLSFNLYQPEDGNLQPIWFERFENHKAHEFHMQQNYFKNAIQVINESLEGEARSIRLKVTDKIPIEIPLIDNHDKKTSHLIILFDVSSEKREVFLDRMNTVTKLYRKNKENLEFNLYVFKENPNKFVLIEARIIRDTNIKEDNIEYVKKISFLMQDLCVTDPINSYWFVKEISQ